MAPAASIPQASLMQIQHEQDEDGGGGEFFIEEKGDRIGELTYALSKGVINIRHTGVEEAFEGRGLGKQLVTEAVKFARERGFKVQASCSFAHALLTKVSAFADVKAP